MVIAKSKKVKPQMYTIKKNMDYNWTNVPEQSKKQEAGVPRAILTPHENSLPFEERHVTVAEIVKIGRNVYRATASPTNAIFECRVLSRQHASLYYEKGHFYIVDNNSSNGTFINNKRCSEYERNEVFSGDIVQFGIPVVENTDNSEKNTFPPVIAHLKLFHPDDEEAKLSYNPTMITPLHLKELYQLNNFVQEAIQREASLESRLRTLRECVERTRVEAQASWELFVGEQRLLMRVHTLESMLSVGKQPDAQHLTQLLNDKRNYQRVAQESLRAAHEQRLALEETLERRSREAAALHHHNCALRLAANNALAELQKLAARCERKMSAARLAITAAEEREKAVRNQLPLAYSVQNGETKMLVLSADSNKLPEPKRSVTLEDAVRALPDYVKMLLPPQLLSKVGIKTVSSEGKSAKEFKLILQKNNAYNENKDEEKVDEEEVGDSCEEKTNEPDLCTDDEKQSRLNHDTGNEEKSSAIDGEVCPDNNANSTYSESSNNREDSPSKSEAEYANCLRVMAGLNGEIRTLRDRLNAVTAENEQLRTVRDELLAAQPEPEEPPADGGDAESYRARIADLQAQLTRLNVAEEANLAEIQRLASSSAEMQAELAFRPTRSDVDDLTAVIEKLRADLLDRDQQLDRLRNNVDRPADRALLDKAVETTRSLENLTELDDDAIDRTVDASKISAEIDEMFRLDFDDEEDDETDSGATVAAGDGAGDVVGETDCEVREVGALKAVEARLSDAARLEVTLHNGTLHALEEELVRAKERWAEESRERARLAAQLATLHSKSHVPLLAVAAPLLAAALYWLLLPYIS